MVPLLKSGQKLALNPKQSSVNIKHLFDLQNRKRKDEEPHGNLEAVPVIRVIF